MGAFAVSIRRPDLLDDECEDCGWSRWMGTCGCQAPGVEQASESGGDEDPAGAGAVATLARDMGSLPPRWQAPVLMEFVERWTRRKGYPPTVREMQDALLVSSTSVMSYRELGALSSNAGTGGRR